MALSWWDGVTLQVEMAFGEPPTAPTAWTDITADVRDIPGGTVGRRSEFQPFAPSSCVIVLDNASRQYDPDYATGPYFGDLVPMVPCRITATVAATDVDVFYGYVKGWPQEWSRFDATSTITLLDGARFQKNETLPQSVYAGAVIDGTPAHYWTFQDVASMSGVDDEVGALPLKVVGTGFVDDGTPTSLSPSQDDRDRPIGQELGWWGLANAGPPATLPLSVEAWVSRSVYTGNSPKIEIELPASASNRNVWAINYVEANTQDIQVFYSNAAQSKRHSTATDTGVEVPPNSTRLKRARHIVATIDATFTTIKVYLDGQLEYSGTLAAGTDLWTGQTEGIQITGNTSGNSAELSTIAHVAFYDAELSASDVSAHYEAGAFAFGYPYGETTGTRMERALDDVGWPSALRNIDTGTQVVGPYRPRSRPVLTELRELEATEQGLLFTAEDGRLTFLDRQTLWTTDTGIVFSDDEAANDVRLAGLVPDGNTVDTILNIVTVSYDQTGAITRRDATSIAAYGAASESITSSPMPTAVAASNMAAYVLRSAKDPSTRYTSMTATVRGQDTNTTRILDLIQRRIGDVVTIERLPVNITPRETKKAMIQGYGFRISRQDWTIDYYLSPAVLSSTDAPYLTLGDATYGQIGATAGNLIPA